MANFKFKVQWHHDCAYCSQISESESESQSHTLGRLPPSQSGPVNSTSIMTRILARLAGGRRPRPRTSAPAGLTRELADGGTCQWQHNYSPGLRLKRPRRRPPSPDCRLGVLFSHRSRSLPHGPRDSSCLICKITIKLVQVPREQASNSSESHAESRKLGPTQAPSQASSASRSQLSANSPGQLISGCRARHTEGLGRQQRLRRRAEG